MYLYLQWSSKCISLAGSSPNVSWKMLVSKQRQKAYFSKMALFLISKLDSWCTWLPPVTVGSLKEGSADLAQNSSENRERTLLQIFCPTKYSEQLLKIVYRSVYSIIGFEEKSQSPKTTMNKDLVDIHIDALTQEIPSAYSGRMERDGRSSRPKWPRRIHYVEIILRL